MSSLVTFTAAFLLKDPMSLFGSHGIAGDFSRHRCFEARMEFNAKNLTDGDKYDVQREAIRLWLRK
jgi:hypothetical protein